MLFRELLDNYSATVQDALDELFSAIKANQTHEQDLLLIEVNGFYVPEYADPNVRMNMKLSPFVFGPGGWEDQADQTQYRFFDAYRRQMINGSREKYLEDFSSNKEKQMLHDLTIQVELMVYLKFWESDRIIKKLYQMSNLALGRNYDWHFTVDKDDSRQEIIRLQIRDPLKDVTPKYYQLIKDIYLSQIRNAVAHSQFYITPGGLGFTNTDEKNHAPLYQMKFDDWEHRFHKLILLYNGLIGKFNSIRSEYVKEQEDKEFGLQIRMTKKDQTEKNSWLKFVTTEGGRSDWMWYDTWKKHYK